MQETLMQFYRRPYKAKLGAVLLKVKSSTRTQFDDNEKAIADILLAKGLLECSIRGRVQLRGSSGIGSTGKLVLTGFAQDIVERFTDNQILAGVFQMPDEAHWSDQWWARSVCIPIVVSLLTAAVTGVAFLIIGT